LNAVVTRASSAASTCAAGLSRRATRRFTTPALTAAVADALTRANISCNIIAAAHHDHLFVPVESARAAIEALTALQQRYQ